LTELTEALTRHVADARGHFYGAAFDRHRRDGLDPAIHDTTPAPTPEGEAAARNAQVLGRNYVNDVLDLVSDTGAGLDSAVLAGGGEFLDGWEIDHRQALTARVHSELSNSQTAIFEAVKHILVMPQFR
jgi:hypothetical protein